MCKPTMSKLKHLSVYLTQIHKSIFAKSHANLNSRRFISHSSHYYIVESIKAA